MPTTVRALDPTDDQLEALHAVLVDAWSVYQPQEPAPTLERARGVGVRALLR